MSAEDSKEKKPIHGGRNLVLLGIGAITIALITTSISLYFYGKGDIYIDRSRPGYISEDEVHQTDEDYLFWESLSPEEMTRFVANSQALMTQLIK